MDNLALRVSDVLETIARHESLRSEIIQNGKILAEMLSSHFPTEILRLIVTFKSLSSHREIRQKVQREYQNLKQDTLYYLDPHHHPHEHDQYTSASAAIESFIVSYDRPTSKVNYLFSLFFFFSCLLGHYTLRYHDPPQKLPVILQISVCHAQVTVRSVYELTRVMITKNKYRMAMSLQGSSNNTLHSSKLGYILLRILISN
ncbi:hypothetical protein EDD22DRAFT_389262 [Suillus occidentalis]|nr:hypothetical protein EDD22DRAFT_389262 [Suillus occidentalis]